MSLRLRLKCHLQWAFGATVASDKVSNQSDPAQQLSGVDDFKADAHDLGTQIVQTGLKMGANPVIDATGLICPLPLLKLKQALYHLNSGETLIMSVDDPNSVQDSRRFCTKLGYEFRAKPDHEQRTICHLWVTKPIC